MTAAVSARLLPLALAASLLAGCGTVSSVMEPIAFDARCNAAAGAVPRANYVGPYLGVENLLTPGDFARDMYCADAIKARLFPRGYVTVFGSSRIGENNPMCYGSECDAEVKRRNDATYAMVKRFAVLWTARHGRSIPIMTGAGPGLMEAANRGASEAGGPSVGYTTYYDPAGRPTPERPYGGDPAKALNRYVGNGLIFTSVVAREAAMIKHSAAMVITPGGTGTEWETYQIIETIKSRQVLPVPVYFLGDAADWASLQARLDDMARRHVTLRQELAFLRFVGSAEELASALRADLRLD
jgi:predicted Rossmann-fold nucleotide-binding protein